MTLAIIGTLPGPGKPDWLEANRVSFHEMEASSGGIRAAEPGGVAGMHEPRATLMHRFQNCHGSGTSTPRRQ
jgi:hypothetical protein